MGHRPITISSRAGHFLGGQRSANPLTAERQHWRGRGLPANRISPENTVWHRFLAVRHARMERKRQSPYIASHRSTRHLEVSVTRFTIMRAISIAGILGILTCSSTIATPTTAYPLENSRTKRWRDDLSVARDAWLARDRSFSSSSRARSRAASGGPAAPRVRADGR